MTRAAVKATRKDADPFVGADADVADAAVRVARVIETDGAIDAEAAAAKSLRAALTRRDTLAAGRGDVVGMSRHLLDHLAEHGSVSAADGVYNRGLRAALESEDILPEPAPDEAADG